jgi:hypothetical protein
MYPENGPGPANFYGGPPRSAPKNRAWTPWHFQEQRGTLKPTPANSEGKLSGIIFDPWIAPLSVIRL